MPKNKHLKCSDVGFLNAKISFKFYEKDPWLVP